jgi:D-glycero-D-manno-heptose 1,7-bisphosphate phosphatase
MIEQAVQDLNLELDGSVVIGDRYGEVEMAHRLGLRAALVLTGYGRGEYEYMRKDWPRQPDWVAENLLAGWRKTFSMPWGRF